MFGSTRIELQHDERAIWLDLIVLASKDSGFVRANPETEYPIKLLAGMLNATEELVERTIQRCLETKKIKKADNGVGYYLLNWQEYQLTERYKRKFQKNVEDLVHSSQNRSYCSQKVSPIGEERRGEERYIEKKADPEVKLFIDYYYEEFKKRFRAAPIINGGKDGSLVKELLGTIGLEELKRLLGLFFKAEDEFIKDSGYTIGVFKSQINKLITGGGHGKDRLHDERIEKRFRMAFGDYEKPKAESIEEDSGAS